MTGYAKKINENSKMSLRVIDEQLLKNDNQIWKKIEKLMRINFESKPVYGDDNKYTKTKIKIYADNMITNFHNKNLPKEKAPRKCLSIMMIDSAIEANKRYYSQTFFGECKHAQEKIKTENYIDEDLESDSDSNDETESDIDE